MSMNIRNGKCGDANTISEIHSMCWREVYSFMPDEVHQARSKDYRKSQWERWFSDQPDGETLLVLTHDETVVGFALSKPNTDCDISAPGEMHAGYVLPEYRGGMSGPAMMKGLAERMMQMGQWPACIWAFKENPHRRFYSALGWHAVVHRDRTIAGKQIPEIGYTSPSYDELTCRLDRMLSSFSQRQILPRERQTSRHSRQAS
ncbi:MAG: GNAT family N-acetyltransferase [Roseibium sp.]|uniref:GNAT family N-acetyltransferase n=1 Tax=Roseibium sp. TaxID=1936156 RepID=UPI00345BB056|nr:GNAT family N-acetyltransferase [Roseibium sp.]